MTAAGTRLGPYEILAPIGAGGMGEVYLARDARLDRQVAIKLLPRSFAADPDRRARFEREARAVAALSHPNILAIFDIGQEGDTVYAVTELLEGETLRERVNAGPLPARKAIEIATQIARGLAAAHDKGIVHRDLKPENVFVLQDGRVKILDFGLARSFSSSQTATTVVGATEPGTVMGTAGYMAPEQVRGQAVDARADLFSFGAVLYEMLAGKRAFQRDTAADTMTAILNAEPPDLAESRGDLPPALDRIVKHCLEKNPIERFRSAHDVAFALEALSGSKLASGALDAVAAAPPARSRRGLELAVAVALALAALVAGGLVGRWSAPSAPLIGFERRTWGSEWITNARFAPDGQTIIFSAAEAGSAPRLFALRRDTTTPQPFGPARTHLLSISSKGELAVLTDARPIDHRLFEGTLARMSTDGAPRAWLRQVRDAAWAPDGSTLAVIRGGSGAGTLEYPIDHVVYQANGYLSDPRVSPDGSRVAFLEHPNFGDNRGSAKVVDRQGNVTALSGEYWGTEGLVWTPDGRSILFSAIPLSGGEQMWPQIVDASGGSPPREAFRTASWQFVHDLTSGGRLLTTGEDLRWSIRAQLPGQSVEREFGWLDWSMAGLLSPDGMQMLFSDESVTAGPNYAVALRRTDGSPVVRLGDGYALGLSPDGQSALALLPSTSELVVYPIGPGNSFKLARGAIEHYRTTGGARAFWTPDGKSVLFCGNEKGRALRGYTQAIAGGAASPITPEGVVQIFPAPDGRRFLEITSSGDVRIASFAEPNSLGAATKGFTAVDRPLGWSRDGRSIFVQASSETPARVERVELDTGTRTLVRQLAPPDQSGVAFVIANQWLDDGAAYTYYYQRDLSRLFVVSNVPLSRR